MDIKEKYQVFDSLCRLRRKPVECHTNHISLASHRLNQGT